MSEHQTTTAAAATPAPPSPRTIVLACEWLLLFALVFAAHRDLPDPSRLLAHLLGHAPSWQHAGLRPGVSLVAGIGNVLLALHLFSLLWESRHAERLRAIVIGWFVFALVLLPAACDYEIRRVIDEAPGNTAPYRSQSHDGGVLQTEDALARLLAGKNLYGDHYATGLMARSVDSAPESWRGVGAPDNPALHHLTYFPAVIVASLPFYALGKLLGAYDQRVVYLLAAFALALLLGRFVTPGPERRMVNLLVFLNPLLRPYLVSGRNDVLVLVPLAAFALALMRQRDRQAAVWLGVAVATKQFALFVVPFFFVERWRSFAGDRRRMLHTVGLVAIAPLLTCVPFLLWDARAFFDDTLLWTSRGGAGAYPLKWVGWGLSVLAYGVDLVPHPLGDNPFGAAGALAQVVALIAGCAAIWQRPTLPRLFFVAAMMLTTTLLFARAYSMSYAITPFCLVAIGALTELRSEGRKR